MNKKIKLTSICIIFLLCVIGYIYNTNNNISLQDNNVTYAISLDGEKTSSFPARGSYKVQVECNNAVGKWLYDEWKLSIEDMLGTSTSCDIDFTSITTKTLLSDYVISLVGKSQGTGKVINENGYRYEGKDPNNYVWFNNEYWRIIGVFDENSHGQTEKNLVKIIRNEVLDGLAWDKSNNNDWSVSSLKALLNGTYYNAQDGTNSGFCYIYSSIVMGNCNYTKKGISLNYRSMISNATWYLGGHSNTNATASELYGYERGTNVYAGKSTSTEGYIGLMYPSDYGYSVLENNCIRTTPLYSYVTCSNQSWLYGKGYEWLLMPIFSNSYGVSYLSSSGIIDNTSVFVGFGVRPVLYLDASVYKIDGDGSLENPYIVGM